MSDTPNTDTKTEEKTTVRHEETERVKLTTGNEALIEAIAKEPPKATSKRLLQLYFICAIAFCGSTMNGYDGSLMGSLLVMKPYQHQFGAEIVGVKAGYISAMMQIGGVVGIPFCGPCADMFGRRLGIFLGCAIIIIGTIVEGTSRELSQFLAGRFLLGFGNTITSVAGPSYVVEIAHPAYRGVITGLYNSMYNVGSFTAACAVRGTDPFTTNQAWLISTWLQMAWPSILLLSVWFLPESPRWLFSHGKNSEARSILTKYHGDDNPDSVYVTLQMNEFERELELHGADKRWWDYRVLFNSRKATFRVACACTVPVSAQLSGNGMVSYFLPALLSTAGVTNSITVLDINLAIPVVSGFFAFVGASMVDRLGRRPIVLTGLIGMSICWACLSAATAVYKENQSVTAAKASIVFIFFTSVVFSFGYTALQNLYPVECFSYEQRAKGMAFQLFALSVAGLVIQFATPVAIGVIGWKLYPIFVAWDLVEALVLYFVMVETKGRTLEELNEIFDNAHPRKMSLMKKRIVLDAAGNLVDDKQT